MPLTPANSDSDNRPKADDDIMSVKSTHHFVSDPVTSASLMTNTIVSAPKPSLGFDMVNAPTQASLVAHVTEETADTIKGSELEPDTGRLSDRDEIMSITSEDSDGNVSIPHGDLDNEKDESTSIHQGQANADNPTSPTEIRMPVAIEAQLNAWYAVHGRGTPPCATSAVPCFLYSRNVSGETAYFVHKSGEHVKACMYNLPDGTFSKNTQSKQRVIVAQGPTQGPFLIKYASQKNAQMAGSSYKIWRGVKGGDKNGFELTPSVHKRYKSTGKVPPKLTPKAKQVAARIRDFQGNEFYAADGTPQNGAEPRPKPTAAAKNSGRVKSSYEFRPSKRLKQDEENPANYSRLLAAFSSSAELGSSRKQDVHQESRSLESNQVTEHIQNNAVFLFYPKKSLQPRVRLFSACNTMQKLFAHALAGDVFDENTTAAKVLSVRIAGQQKARAVLEDDEQDFDDVVGALKDAPCWLTADGGISGSCTVEVRAKSWYSQ